MQYFDASLPGVVNSSQESPFKNARPITPLMDLVSYSFDDSDTVTTVPGYLSQHLVAIL